MKAKLHAIIIAGATASGKTGVALKLSDHFSVEIVNADSRQFYTPLSIGTAKPTKEEMAKAPHHLFDVFDKPIELSVVEYRKLVGQKVSDICSRGKTPVLVGGSLFYLKSLFFPPTIEEEPMASLSEETKSIPEDQRWNELNKIDPERAKHLHKNDSYRVDRALDIWFRHKKKPSECKPKFDPICPSMIIYLDTDRETIRTRIETRLKTMLAEWILEVKPLLNSVWEEFWDKKGIIGYQEVAKFIRQTTGPTGLEKLIEQIFYKTYDYAKRQKCFWRSFKEQLSKFTGNNLKLCEIKVSDDLVSKSKSFIANFLDK